MIRYTLIILLVATMAMADNIYLKNGNVLMNVKILKQTDEWIYIESTKGKARINNSMILKIISIPFNPDVKSEVIEASPLLKQSSNTKYPNLKLLPISVIAFALAWDYGSQINDISKSIKSAKENGWPYNYLESQRTRKRILFVGFIAAGIANAIISFQSVEVSATSNKISLTYRF